MRTIGRALIIGAMILTAALALAVVTA